MQDSETDGRCSGGIKPLALTCAVPHYASSEGGIITVIGSGGKTSLIWLLAQQGRREGTRTLVTTTTHMAFPPPESGWYDYFLDFPHTVPDGFKPAPGISLAGIREGPAGKGRGPSPQILASLAPRFDRVLIEGDGSRMLPLKAWADYEPVVPTYTTVTLGILPLWPVGLPVSSERIHRLPLFSALTGAQPGEILELHHLAPVITGMAREHPHSGQGLFSKAQGKKLLFFNQVEDEAGLNRAEALVSLLPGAFLRELSGIIIGSVQQNRTYPPRRVHHPLTK